MSSLTPFVLDTLAWLDWKLGNFVFLKKCSLFSITWQSGFSQWPKFCMNNIKSFPMLSLSCLLTGRLDLERAPAARGGLASTHLKYLLFDYLISFQISSRGFLIAYSTWCYILVSQIRVKGSSWCSWRSWSAGPARRRPSRYASNPGLPPPLNYFCTI